MIKEIGTQDFEQEVVALSKQKPVLVDFYAQWCAPCKMMVPILDTVAEHLEGRAEIRKVDIDTHFQLAHRFGIRSIPTMHIWKGGEMVETLTGMRASHDLQNVITRYL